jgi:hypothetical protein
MLFVFILALNGSAAAADKDHKMNKSRQNIQDAPIVPINSKYHKIGRMWQRVTNFGKMGDDAYTGRTPSGDWPGGTGNSYLYRGSVWLTAKVDGVVHSTQTEDNEYSPIDSVHVMSPGIRSFEDTYTKYYDVKVPGATGHVPLGLEVTERTYAWKENYRYDFIIYELTIKNVGIDTNNDGYPDTPRDLQEFYFTYRLDGDVSKLSDWDAEGPYCNEDDLAGINSSWNFLDKFPEWEAENPGLTAEDADTSMIFMFDADNPSVPSEYKDPVSGNFVEDDLGNPGPDGKLQTPGFLGLRICKTEPASFKISKFRTGHIYNDPATDQESYDRFMKPTPSEDPYEEQGPSGVVVNPQTGDLFPLDYRGFLTLGPMDTFAAGDSIVITFAIGVGADPERGGIYSLVKLVDIMKMAQIIVDSDYTFVLESPPPPNFTAANNITNGVTTGIKVNWDMTAESSGAFEGYWVFKTAKSTGVEDTLHNYYINDASWPPPTTPGDPSQYQIVDTDVINGFDYSYKVQSYGPVVNGERLTENVAPVEISPANPVANKLDNVKVVPNPYIGSAAWNNPRPSDIEPWQDRLQFINLPADATIKIFTLDGDFVDEIKAGQGVVNGLEGNAVTANSVAEWDLITRNNQDCAPGIYMFVVQSPSLGEKVGKFVIIR